MGTLVIVALAAVGLFIVVCLAIRFPVFVVCLLLICGMVALKQADHNRAQAEIARPF